VDQYLSIILGLEQNQSYAAMLGLVVQFCTAQKETDIVKRHKVSLSYWFFLARSSVTSCHGEGGWTDVSVGLGLILCICPWFHDLSIQ